MLIESLDPWATYQVVEHAFVQAPLSWPALPQLLVVVVQALVVGAELLKAGLVDIFDTAVEVSELPPLRHATIRVPVSLPTRAPQDHRERAHPSEARPGVDGDVLGSSSVRTRSSRTW